MAVTINASTSAGLVNTADTSGVLALQNNGTVGFTMTSGSVDLPVAGAILTLNRGQYSQQTKFYQDTGGTGAIYETTNPSVNAQYYAHNFKGTNNGPTTLDFAKFNQFGLGLGSASPSSGTGITFPATQSASSDVNTLDDYEEGSWTPVLNFGGVAGVSVYAQQNGTYTRIGNVVNVRCYISISTKSAATGAAILAGLPFPTKSVSAQYHSGTVYMSNGSITGAPMCYLDAGASSVNLGQTNGSTGYVNIANSSFVNGGDFIFQASYFTT